MATPRLSIVVPCYDEERGLPEFYARMSRAAADAVGAEYELILVDDGSRDGTWPVIADLSRRDDHVVGVQLFRNHGHQLAVTAGLSVARGGRVMLIDADLQDPPELLLAMMRELDGGAEVAYGQRIARGGETRFKLWSAALFYRGLERISAVPIPRDTGDFRLMSRRVADALAMMPERHRFIRGMVSWIGGRQVAIPYQREARYAGESKYPLAKMVRFAVDAITSFSTAPLRFATWLGIVTSGLAFLLILYTVARWLTGQVIPGWASAVVSSSLFAGIQLFVLGIMGEYLGRLVEEAKGRPLFIINAIDRRGERYAPPVEFARASSEARHAMLDMLEDGAGPAADRPAPPATW